jgi:hypothetical protein
VRNRTRFVCTKVLFFDLQSAGVFVQQLQGVERWIFHAGMSGSSW